MVSSAEPVTAVFEPLRVGGLQLKNRIYVSSHTYGYVTNGVPTPDFGAYVGRRLAGGVALLVLGETLVAHSLAYGAKLWGEAVSGPSLDRFYERVSTIGARHDAAIFEQLFHPGGQVWPTPGAASFGPSRVHHESSTIVPWALSGSEISRLLRAFAEAGARAADHGIRGIEIKADQGKLHHQFLSPVFNQRTDAYGGSVSARAGFLRQTAEALRESVGTTTVVGVRLPTSDGYGDRPNGTPDTIPNWLLETLEELSTWSIFDYVALSHGTNSTRKGYRIGHADETLEPANARDAAGRIRAATRLPLFVSSNIRDIAIAEELVRDGTADMVAMTRAHIADPALVSKAARGRGDLIRPCVACNQGCVGNGWVGRPIRCTVNPETGRERILRSPVRAHNRSDLDIAVVGGGPSGLELAVRLAVRHRRVCVIEQNAELGGQLTAAAHVYGRQKFADFLDYQIRRVKAFRNIEVVRGRPVTDPTELLADWDRVVAATGSVDPPPWSVGFRRVDPGPGLPDWSSPSGAAMLPARSLLDQRVLVVDLDWTQSTLGLAAHLARQGADVAYATPMDLPGGETDFVTQGLWLREISRYKGTVRTGLDPLTVIGRTVIFWEGSIERAVEFKDVDMVVFAATRGPSLREATNEHPRIRIIGDAVFPRGLEFALTDAAACADGPDRIN